MKYIKPLLFILLVGLTACFNPPSFPDAPEISFKSIQGEKRQDALGNTQDYISVTIAFQDGDGDLGLSEDDKDPPYQEFILDDNGNEVINYFHHNYHLLVKRIENGVIEPVLLPSGLNLTKNGRFPLLINENGPIEGELTFGDNYITIAGSALNQLDTIILEITIVDRALNISNTIESDPIVIGDY